MNYHERHEKQVVYAQLICFLLASIFSFTADLFTGADQQIIPQADENETLQSLKKITEN